MVLASLSRSLPSDVVDTRCVFRARLNKAFFVVGSSFPKRITFRVRIKYLGFGFLNFLFLPSIFPPLLFFLSTPFFVRRDERGGERKRRPSPDDDDDFDDDDDDDEEAEKKKNQPPFFFCSSFSSFDVRSLDALGSF